MEQYAPWLDDTNIKRFEDDLIKGTTNKKTQQFMNDFPAFVQAVIGRTPQPFSVACIACNIIGYLSGSETKYASYCYLTCLELLYVCFVMCMVCVGKKILKNRTELK